MRVITVTLVTVALFLAGCTSSAEPTSLPPSPTIRPDVPSPSAFASPTATPASDDESPSPTQAAKSHLEAYFNSANRVARGADIEEHRAYYTSSCLACESATSDFLDARDRGLVASGDRYQSWTVEPVNAETNQVLLTSVIEFAAVDLVSPSGDVVEAVPPWSGASFAWTLAKQPNGDWLIVQGQLLS